MPEILQTLVVRFADVDAFLVDIRTIPFCLLGFVGFF